MLLYRNKSHSAAQLLMVMADVYNNYLRLRLSDVLLKKDRCSKTVEVPLSDVTHDGGSVYTVNSKSQDTSQYTVDLSIGMCTCSKGNSVCKHQIAASQFSAVRLPQMHSCTSSEKKHLYKLIYADKPLPTPTFLGGLSADAPADAVTHVNLPRVACGQPQTDANQVEEVAAKMGLVAQPSSVASETSQSFQQRIDQFTSMLNEELKRKESPCIFGSLDIFEQRVKACRNPVHFSTVLRIAGCALFKGSGSFRKRIPCQPTNILRRISGQPRGKTALLKGRIVKRKHYSSLNISKNLPNAKIH